MAALYAIVRRHLAVIDCSHAAVCGVGLTLTIARRAIPCGSVEITRRVVTRFGLLITEPGRDVSVPRSQPGLTTAHRRQFVGPGIFAVLRGMGTIFGCNFAVKDGSFAAVGSLSAPRVGARTFVSRPLTVARRAVACCPVAITGRVVTSFSLSIAQPGRDVTVPRRQSGLPTAHGGQLIGPGILAVPGRLRAIVRCNLAVVDGSFAAVRGIGAPRVGACAFVCRAPAIARRSIPCGAVELSGRVVTRFGVSVTLLGGEVTCPCGQPRIFAILRGLGAIVGCKSAVVDRLGAVIRSLSAPQCGLSAFVRRAPAIGRRSIPFGSVKITCRVITRFGLSVAQPGRDITSLSSHARLTTAHACQLVGPGICAVLRCLGTVFGRHLAVVDGLGAVVCRASAPRRGLVTFVCRILTVGRRAVTCSSVKVTRRVITGFGLLVTQPGRDITALGSKPCLATAHARQFVGPGIFAIPGGLGAVLGRNLAVIDSLGAVVGSLRVREWRWGTFACRLLILARRRLSVTPLGISVTHVRGQIAIAPF